MRFIAIDLETANADRSSICAVGAVQFENGRPIREWYSLVNPEDHFDPRNVHIHGIDAGRVKDAPRFPEVLDALVAMAPSGIAVAHTSFDRVSMNRATERYACSRWAIDWLDSARIARRAWPEQFGTSGYGLASVAAFLGIKFKHHDALEDARTAGLIVCRAAEVAGLSLEEWGSQLAQPGGAAASKHRMSLQGNPIGRFTGETVVFTGSLSVPRKEAAIRAADVGFNVAANVTKDLTVLVIGNQDARKLAGQPVSSKQRKAEELIAAGHPIAMLTEADFFGLIGPHLEDTAPSLDDGFYA
jgi:DNA polymerase III subunit epsilon